MNIANKKLELVITSILALLFGFLLEVGPKLNAGGYNGGGVEDYAAEVFIPWDSVNLYCGTLLNALLVFVLLLLLWRALDWLTFWREIDLTAKRERDRLRESAQKPDIKQREKLRLERLERAAIFDQRVKTRLLEREKTSKSKSTHYSVQAKNAINQISLTTEVAPKARNPLANRWIWICFFGFLACWLVFWLALWPGVFNYDAQAQYEMLTYYKLQSHHPLLHTLLLDGLVLFGENLLNSSNSGVAIYVGLQLLVMSAVFTLMLQTMVKEGAGKILIGFSFAFLAVNPAVVTWLLCTTKDVLFSGFALLFILLLYRVIARFPEFQTQDALPASLRKLQKSQLKPGIKICLALGLILFLLLAFRTSAVFTVIVFLVFACLLIKKFIRPRLMATMLLALAVFILANLVISVATPIQSGPWQTLDALSLQRQQLTRAWILAGDEDTAEFKQVFEQWELEYLYRYQADDADTSRIAFRDIYEQDLPGLASLYLSQGLKHPDIYLDAALLTNYEAWYPGAMVDGYVMDGYGTDPSFARSSYINTLCEWPATEVWFIPIFGEWLHQFGLGNIGDQNVFVRLLCSPAVYIWILLIALARSIILRSRRSMLICVFLTLIGLTALLSPIVVVRYYLPVIFGLPLLLHQLSRVQKLS